MKRPQEIKNKIDLFKILFLIALLHLFLFIILILICQLLKMEHQIRCLSAADNEHSCSLTISFYATFSVCTCIKM